MSERTMIGSATSDVTKGTSGRTTGAITGAAGGASAAIATGAALGSSVGPVGTAVGAVVGAVVGVVAGAMRDSGEFYANKGHAWAKYGKDRDQSIQARDYLRQFRMARAAAIAGVGAESGGLQSSAPAGAISSLGAQYGFGTNYMDSQVFIQRKASKNYAKAKKFSAASSDMFAIMDAGFNMAPSIAGAYSSWQAGSMRNMPAFQNQAVIYAPPWQGKGTGPG